VDAVPSAAEIFATVDHALDTQNIEEAQQWRQILTQEIPDPRALTLLGRLDFAVGDHLGGLALIGEAIRHEPYYEPAYRIRSHMYASVGDIERAMYDLEVLLLYYPLHHKLIGAYAQLAMKCGRHLHARHRLERLIRTNPQSGFLFNLLGLLHQQQSELSAAQQAYRRAIYFEPRNAQYYNNLGTAMHESDQFVDAEHILRQALQIDPTCAMAWYNLGNVVKDCRRLDEAEHCYRRAIALRHDYPDARLNLGCILIQQDRWAEGWQQYEWRWRVPDLMPPLGITLPRWTGESLAGKHLVVVAEQGFGDTLQFVRYLSRVVTQARRVSLLCPPTLAGLMSRMHPEIDVLIDPFWLTGGDCYAPLMSLPGLLNERFESMPPAPYITVEEEHIAYFRERLGPRRGRLRIGLIWGGNPQQMDDVHRSVPLERLGALFALKGVRWIGLQKGAHRDELREHIPIEDWSDELNDFDDTAACMSALDGVVSVCSSPLHLAGALGVRTIGLLHWAGDWRWRNDDQTTPWYPSIRLVRQPEFDAWEAAAEAAAAEIATWQPLPLPRRRKKEISPITKPAPMIRTQTLAGTMDLLRYDVYQTPALIVSDSYCPDELGLLARYLRPGGTVIEGGAHVGTHTLPLAQIVGENGRVLCFEPQPEAYRLLRRNIRRADLRQVEARSEALGAEPGSMVLPDINYTQSGNFGGVSLVAEATHGEQHRVARTSIDALQLDACDVVKLDVEGAECAVLEGAVETIKRLRPVLFFEIAHNRGGVEAMIPTWLAEYGYRCYVQRSLLYERSAQPIEARLTSVPAPLQCWSLSCLAVPGEREQPSDLTEMSLDLSIDMVAGRSPTQSPAKERPPVSTPRRRRGVRRLRG